MNELSPAEHDRLLEALLGVCCSCLHPDLHAVAPGWRVGSWQLDPCPACRCPGGHLGAPLAPPVVRVTWKTIDRFLAS